MLAVGRDAHAILSAGGIVTIGSHGEQHGLAAHWDMWLLQLSGFTPFEALRSATLSGAQKLGLEKDIGSLEAGKVADFLVLNGNPLDDIRQSANIDYVIQGGVVYDAETLTRLYPSYLCLKRPRRKLAAEWKELHKCAPPIRSSPLPTHAR